MHGAEAAALLLALANTALQVSGESGVWSAFSFLGDQAGKRSTDENQELYLSGEDQVADASYDVEYEEYEEPEPRVEPYRRRRRPYRRRRKNKQPPSQDFYAGADTDRDSQYKPPTSGYQVPDSYEEPSSYDAPPYDGYDAPSYAASSPSYGAPSYSGGGGKDSFNDFLNALAAFLPIGLFLAAIPPNLIVINSTARRRRHAEDEESSLNSLEEAVTERPFLRRLAALGPGLWGQQCQAQIFCQMAEMGRSPEANSVQRLLAAATSMTPDFAAEMIGVRDVFQASREARCSKFKCDDSGSR